MWGSEKWCKNLYQSMECIYAVFYMRIRLFSYKIWTNITWSCWSIEKLYFFFKKFLYSIKKTVYSHLFYVIANICLIVLLFYKKKTNVIFSALQQRFFPLIHTIDPLQNLYEISRTSSCHFFLINKVMSSRNIRDHARAY